MPGSDSDSSEDEEEQDEGGGPRSVRRRAARPAPVPLDASIKLWDFGIPVDG